MSTSATPSSSTAAALAARRRHSHDALARVEQAITRLRRDKARISVAAISRHAAVSRTFLYENPQARALVHAAVTATPPAAGPASAASAASAAAGTVTTITDGRDSSWRERALNAENAVRAAQSEISVQRTRLGELMGRIRDLESDWTQAAVQRITTENTTLKQRVRELDHANRNLDERLQAARSNQRFQDRRIAELEARLCQPPPPPARSSPPRRTDSTQPEH